MRAGWPFLRCLPAPALGRWACPRRLSCGQQGACPPAGLALQPWQWCREPGALFPGPPAPP